MASFMLKLVTEALDPWRECLDFRLSLGVLVGVTLMLDDPSDSDMELMELFLECSFFRLLLGVLPGVVVFLPLLLLFSESLPSSPPRRDLGSSFTRFGWNFRKDAQAMASCTIPSCHMNAANTARMHCATEGDMASFTALRREPDLDPDLE